MQQLLITAAR